MSNRGTLYVKQPLFVIIRHLERRWNRKYEVILKNGSGKGAFQTHSGRFRLPGRLIFMKGVPRGVVFDPPGEVYRS